MDKQLDFLIEYAKYGSIEDSVNTIGETLDWYFIQQRDPDFKKKIKQLEDIFFNRLMVQARKEALNGDNNVLINLIKIHLGTKDESDLVGKKITVEFVS